MLFDFRSGWSFGAVGFWSCPWPLQMLVFRGCPSLELNCLWSWILFYAKRPLELLVLLGCWSLDSGAVGLSGLSVFRGCWYFGAVGLLCCSSFGAVRLWSCWSWGRLVSGVVGRSRFLDSGAALLLELLVSGVVGLSRLLVCRGRCSLELLVFWSCWSWSFGAVGHLELLVSGTKCLLS